MVGVSGGPTQGGNSDGARLLSLLDAVADPERSKRTILELEERRAAAEEAEAKANKALADLTAKENEIAARELNVSLDEGKNASDLAKNQADEAALRERIDRVASQHAEERDELNKLAFDLNDRERAVEEKGRQNSLTAASLERREAVLSAEQQRLEGKIDRLKRAMMDQ